MSDRPHIVLLDLYVAGHHRAYLEMLVRGWIEKEIQGLLSVVVTPEFLKAHPDFQSWIDARSGDGVQLHVHRPSIEMTGGDVSKRQLLRLAGAHRRAAEEVIEDLRPDHLVFMYFDHAQLTVASPAAMAFPKRTRVSGICFRTSFHYEWSNWKDRVLARLKEVILRRALSASVVHRVFFLDPYAVDELRSYSSAVYLPDAIRSAETTRSRVEQRRIWRADPDDCVLLFFGAVSERKGIMQALAAFETMEPAQGDTFRLIIAGRIDNADRTRVESAVRESLLSDRIIVDERYVPDSEMAAFYAASDAVLIPYVGHIGSSSIMLHAAAAGKPVIGPDSGLVARQIRDFDLGLTVDTTSPEAIADALRTISTASFDPSSSRSFASRHTESEFADTFFNEILD